MPAPVRTSRSPTKETNRLAEVVAMITKRRRIVIALRLTLRPSKEVDSMIAAITRQLGNIGIPVNNVRGRKLEDLDLALFDEAINLTLRSAFLVTSIVVLAICRSKWRRLIFISSNVRAVGGPRYAASKAGVIGLMD
jgi:NAD(P)-dependent dehydrogenase (short-subunit alcohol dehydrogenase family)